MDKIIEYIKQKNKELDEVAVVDDGTLSCARETFQEVIRMLQEEIDKQKIRVDVCVPLNGPVAEEVFKLIKNKLEIENYTC